MTMTKEKLKPKTFKNGDTLILKEWDKFRKKFTGRKLARTVT